MAKLILILLLIQIIFLAVAVGKNNGDFTKPLNRKKLGFNKKEKLTHLQVYWHDLLSGPNPTSIMIQKPVSKFSSSSFFGSITMMDNALTSDVPINSTIVGQAQGVYAGAAQKELGYLVVMNFVFTTGTYNGSTITILGRNKVMSNVREMPIVGGSGMFRFARGYVEARTKWLDQKSGDATVEYNCYVLHY